MTIAAAAVASSAFAAIASASPARTLATSVACDTSWTGTAGDGMYTNAANWDHGIPNGNNGCITLSGTYTVHLQGTSPSAATLNIGGLSGTQTLSVESTCSANAILATSSGVTINSTGALLLTNADSCGVGATVQGGPVTNTGTITVALASGGVRRLSADVTNNGTIAVHASTSFDASGRTLTNHGAINIDDGTSVGVSGGASFANATGGAINASGAAHNGNVFVSGTGTFTEDAGITSGVEPVIVDASNLAYTGSGQSTIGLRGPTNLSGNLAAGQVLSIESTCSENASANAAVSFTSAGSITLTNADSCGNSASMNTSTGTLTNSGTLTIASAAGGGRTVSGNLTNTGTIAVHLATSFPVSGTTLTNNGAITIDNATTLSVFGGASFTNGTGGSIQASGSGNVVASGTGTFTEGSGTTSGVEPVIVDDSSLAYTGSGQSTIGLRGITNLGGVMGSTQSLSIESTCGENASARVPVSLTSAGSITLTNADVCGDNATLGNATGPVTNTGTITVALANGGQRNLSADVTNNGTIAVHAATSFGASGRTLTNHGAINIADGTSLGVSGGASFANATGGAINASGAAHNGNVFVSGTGTFTEDAGITSGVEPVIVDASNLAYTGSGQSTIGLRGPTNLSGNLAAGQVLSIESTCSENATANAAVSFTSAGSITLTNADVCGDNANLNTSTGTLTNSGTLTIASPSGGARTVSGNLTNTGTIAVNANLAYAASGTTLTNNGTINVATGRSLSVAGGASFTNGTTGGSLNAAGTGNVFQSGGTFTQGNAKIKGKKAAIVDDGTLVYAGHGTGGPIALRGSDTLTGNLAPGQLLQIESTCSENALASDPASLNNGGSITLTNGDSCGTNAGLTLNNGAGTLTNLGTLAALAPSGGSRTLNANLTQSTAGKYQASVAPTGRLDVSGATTLAGGFTALPHPKAATVGQAFQILDSASLTGTFSTGTGAINTGGLYYQPTYPGSSGCGGFGGCVQLVVAQATMALSSSSVAPGGTLTVSGGGWPANDTLTITFTDAAKVKTTYPTTTTTGSGAFSDTITIPSGAAAGAGKVLVTSHLTGAQFQKAITVS